MELEKQANLVGDIRAELMDRINTRLKVRANMGRSKIVECEARSCRRTPLCSSSRSTASVAARLASRISTSTFLPAWSNCSTPKRKSHLRQVHDDETEENAAASALEMLLSDDLEDDADDDL